MTTHLELVRTVEDRSIERWGEKQATTIVGGHASIAAVVEQTARYAPSDSPVLVMGETGTGKELFARAIYLLSGRCRGQFVGINCAQYQEGQLIASELFGHKRGSFTGAVTDHRGFFETAQDGVIFLDEVGELSLQAQAMLLRLLGEGEIVPVGETRGRRVNVRTVVATNRDLKTMVDEGRFRADLYYRLRHLQLRIPPVRARGEDWRLILDHYLERLVRAGKARKQFSAEALAVLSRHDWPGNVREIRSVVDTGFHLSDGETIDPRDFAQSLEAAAGLEQMRSLPIDSCGASLYDRLLAAEGSFWTLVHEPYLERDLNRREVRDLIARGLAESGGQYKKLLGRFGIAPGDYLKFMDFLRHHRLKPTGRLHDQ